jgi:hypothetical protein
MLRSILGSVVMVSIISGTVLADSPKDPKASPNQALHATFVKADLAKNMVTFKLTDKSGTTKQLTLPLSKDAKVLGVDDKPVSLASFAKYIQNHKDKSIIVLEEKGHNQIIELMDEQKKK